ARAAGDLEKMMFGTTRWIYALFEAGEIAGVDRAMEELESVVRQIRQPQYTYVQAGFVTMRALFEGRFTEAEQLALQALTLGRRMGILRGGFEVPGAACRHDGPVAGGRIALRPGIDHECPNGGEAVVGAHEISVRAHAFRATYSR